MTFDLIRLGLPNTAAIVALAFLPIVALTALSETRPAAGQVEQIETQAICRAPFPCAEIAMAAAAPEFVLE